MSVSQIDQNQAELLYIDSMLSDASCQEFNSNDKQKLSDKKMDESDVVVDETLYQIASIAGVKFAARLMNIKQQLKYEDTAISDDSIVHEGRSYFIVDVANLLNSKNTITENSVFLLINDMSIALLCEEILNIEKIENNEVCWRSENSKRKWLAGTCKKQGVAILDVVMLKQTLL